MRLGFGGAVIAVVLSAGACGKSDKTYEIAEVREPQDACPVAQPKSAADRFFHKPDSTGNPHAGGSATGSPGGTSFVWQTPAGWTETGASQFRSMGWSVAGQPDLEASLSTAGGTLLMNVNRWRGQMGLKATDDAAVAALEKKTLFGRPASLVELTGTLQRGAMGGEAKTIEGAKMLGLIAELPATSAFLKLSGPAAAVDAEKERFLALAASIRMGEGDHGGITPSPSAAAPGTTAAADADEEKPPFSWTAPEGWEKQPARPMRLVTYLSSAAKNAPIAVSLLKGDGGGLAANLNRWREQMGAKPLTDAEIAALPRAKVLGGEAVFVTIEGSWSGMGGGAGQGGQPGEPDSVFLGMVLIREPQSVFVKMVGPAAEVRGEEKRFRAFCESFHE